MKNPLCLFIVIVIAFTACDQGSEMLEPVIKDIMEDETSVVTDDTPVVPDAPSVYSQYDVNQDSKVDNVDVGLVAASIGRKPTTNPRLDINGNGIVDGGDLILIGENLGDIPLDSEKPLMPEPTQLPVETSPEIPAITFENALDLMVGKRYRLRPIDLLRLYIKSVDPDEAVLDSVYWGNIDQKGMLVEREDFPADAPKIHLEIWFSEHDPYFYTIDGDPVVGITLTDDHTIYDEIVVEITSKTGIGDGLAGQRGNKFPYKHVGYQGFPIENLTNPDRVFEEYE